MPLSPVKLDNSLYFCYKAKRDCKHENTKFKKYSTGNIKEFQEIKMKKNNNKKFFSLLGRLLSVAITGRYPATGGVNFLLINVLYFSEFLCLGVFVAILGGGK